MGLDNAGGLAYTSNKGRKTNFKRNMELVKVTYRVYKEDAQKVNKMAKKLRISISEFIRRLIREYK